MRLSSDIPEGVGPVNPVFLGSFPCSGQRRSASESRLAEGHPKGVALTPIPNGAIVSSGKRGKIKKIFGCRARSIVRLRDRPSGPGCRHSFAQGMERYG
jgi:hypothetical protein